MQGDFYQYTALSAADQAKVKLNGYYYNRDYHGIMYKVRGVRCCTMFLCMIVSKLVQGCSVNVS